jgi:hypothetical protein
MTKPDQDKRICLMRRHGSHLVPCTAFDAEMVEELGNGDIEVSFRNRRSNEQLRAYWAYLGDVVAATECYPNSERLHDALKWAMGYTSQMILLNGEIVTVVDSVALSRMTAIEFTEFFRHAQRLIAERFGFSKEEITA